MQYAFSKVKLSKIAVVSAFLSRLHQSTFHAVFPCRTYITRDLEIGHTHSRQPTCGNAAHEALLREKVTFDAAADE